MGKRKKIKKQKRVELSKTERFVKRVIKKLFMFLAIFPFSFVILNFGFYSNVNISVELYFLIIYVTALAIALYICFGMYYSLHVDKAWNSKKIKSSLLIWLARTAFTIILIIDIKTFVFPMTLDVPGLVTTNYKKINGVVKSIKTNDYERETGGRRGKWYEKIKYIYFTQQTSDKTIKITFHANANKPDIGYNIKTVYYLPHTKWGMKAE